MLAGQINARPMHFWAREILSMDAGIQRMQCDGIQATLQLYRTPIGVSLENADLFFPHVGQQVPVPTSDCCKELLTVTLTPFFLLLFHVTCPFFLTPVAKSSHGFEKVQPGA